jgi:hypothetical protein
MPNSCGWIGELIVQVEVAVATDAARVSECFQAHYALRILGKQLQTASNRN